MRRTGFIIIEGRRSARRRRLRLSRRDLRFGLWTFAIAFVLGSAFERHLTAAMAAAIASMNASGPPPEALPDTRREARDVRPAHISIDRPDTAHERGRGIDLRAIDGDTVEIRMTRERVRLANIDTPESGDRARCSAERVAAETATRAIASLIDEARTVKVTRTGRVDAYGRTIGAVLVDGRDLGRLMIEAGHARPWRGRREPWCAQSGALLR